MRDAGASNVGVVKHNIYVLIIQQKDAVLWIG
jgi:hypothetical protein